MDADTVDHFSERFTAQVHALETGLHMRWSSQGEYRPYTEEGWLPRYVEVRDLVRIMKKTRLGRQLINERFGDDWAKIEKWSGTAANRHRGMVEKHGWRTFKRLRNFEFIETYGGTNT